MTIQIIDPRAEPTTVIQINRHDIKIIPNDIS